MMICDTEVHFLNSDIYLFQVLFAKILSAWLYRRKCSDLSEENGHFISNGKVRGGFVKLMMSYGL